MKAIKASYLTKVCYICGLELNYTQWIRIAKD